MFRSMRWLIAPFAILLLVATAAPAADDAKDQDKSAAKSETKVPSYTLVEASSKGLVTVDARGTGDGRITVSVTNKTGKPLRVILPPGLVAQTATGQMGGMMGGMGGGMGGMGGGGMGGMGGGGMGGMGGGMSGGMGGMGGMGGGGSTMPPMMGMMMLSRLIMYFCGDFDSWDPRSLMMGMGGGGMGMGGGMGGMGGGMGGGMMGGGMRSVAPSTAAFADLRPRQTRSLPTRLVGITAPDPEVGAMVPERDERLRIVGDVSKVSADPRIQKALRRLSAEKVPSSVAQLVMWRVSAGLEWDVIAQLAERWVNPYELTLARDFVDRLDQIREDDGETGSLLFQVEGTGQAGQTMAAELTAALRDKTVLGLRAKIGIPSQPEGPSVACRVRFQGDDAMVQVVSSDGTARSWVAFGKFSLKARDAEGTFDAAKVADGVAEGIIGRLVRAQMTKGPREKGKLIYLVRIDNASPLILSGLAIRGAASKADDPSKVLTSIGVPPRKYITLPASEDVVKTLGLKHGIRVTALDLSGL